MFDRTGVGVYVLCLYLQLQPQPSWALRRCLIRRYISSGETYGPIAYRLKLRIYHDNMYDNNEMNYMISQIIDPYWSIHNGIIIMRTHTSSLFSFLLDIFNSRSYNSYKIRPL